MKKILTVSAAGLAAVALAVVLMANPPQYCPECWSPDITVYRHEGKATGGHCAKCAKGFGYRAIENEDGTFEMHPVQ